ncbi:MAG: ISAs1 family transposase [Mariprofundaceae bacterium]|nr:ISAs1 family transposase [Mariprofundaceae bacterium]
MRSIVAVTAKRECNGKESEETPYFICSLDAEYPKRLGQIVRSHWEIENKLHWVLDYAFDEDSNRARKENSAANMAEVRHIALNLIKADKSSKIGIKNRRLKAGWDNDYMALLLLDRA